MIKNIFDEKQGKLQKILAMFAMALIILLISLGINAAQNITLETSEDILVNEEALITDTIGEEMSSEDDKDAQENSELGDLCVNTECEDSNLKCPDGFVVSCSNSCNSETGECSSCNLYCTGHEPLNENISKALPEVSEEEIINETQDNTQPFTEPEELPVEEETGSENSESSSGAVPGSEIVLDSEPSLNIKISHPDKITRNGITEINATITNSGAKTKNVIAKWILPEGFEIISGDNMEDCGNLKTNESCISTINIQVSPSSSLGINEIKILVSYKK